MRLALIVFTLLLSGSYISFAQQDATPLLAPPEPPAPLLILHVDGETIELDPDKREVPDLESLDPKAMTSIQVLSGSDATLHYGNKGRNGVIIIEFKPYYILPPQLRGKEGDGK
jgi:hypothetical protein